MCYDVGIKEGPVQLKLFDDEILKKIKKVKRHQSGFEYDDWPILQARDGKIDVVDAHWEFIPFWVNSLEDQKLVRKGFDPKTGQPKIDPKTGKRVPAIPTLNAKGETVLTSPLYRNAARNGRCLFIVSCFYERRHYRLGGDMKDRIAPYIIWLKETPYFTLAGISQSWTDKLTGQMMDTAAIITTEANAFMDPIHNTVHRMPVILPPELALEWLTPDIPDSRITQLATYQFAGEMEAHPIPPNFKDLNDPGVEYEYEGMPKI